ncbi:MAG: carboxylesterase family protein [Sphingomonadales bacterium]|nr:carboxylesterase family protein [Sphingomonadales bacterium]
MDQTPEMIEKHVQLAAGMIEGTCHEGVCRYFAVPYAAPPVGTFRFAPPQPVEPWEGLRDARRRGPSAPHKVGEFPQLDVKTLVGDGGERGDDYLTLNIWAPTDARDAPVMVFIHGGGYVTGNKDAPVHDGSGFARRGVICIAINYRLGIDGFLPIEGIPTNLGLRDMLAALRWVQDNAAAFGGDAGNVTVFGESAGAMAIANLLGSPLARGLFRRAIVQSGHGSMVREIPVARRLVARLARILRIPATAQGFAGVPFDTAWAAMEKVSRPWPGIDLRDAAGHEPVFGISRFIPVYGDGVLPEHPLRALEQGAGADVDLLIGTNLDEMNLYFVPTRVRDRIPAMLARWFVGRSHPDAGGVLRAYGLGTRGRKAGVAMTEALTDLVFRWPARQFAAAHRGRTHMYEFDWRSPACGGQLGAAHAMEMPFVFDTLACASGPKGIAGEAPPQALAERIQARWAAFARDGSLPWPEFDSETRQVHHLAADRTISEPVMPAAAFLPA